MKLPTISNEVKDYATRSLGSGIVIFLSLRLARFIFKNWRESLGLEEEKIIPHHSHIGIPVTALGLIAHDHKASPYLFGGGLGLIFEDLSDLIKFPEGEKSRKEYIKEHIQMSGMGEGMPYDDWDIHEYKVNMSPLNPKGSYKKLIKHIAKLVNHDTYNRKLGKTIEAGYRHPSVVWTARRIVGNAGANGYNPQSVAMAIHSWVLANKGYILDPVGGHKDDAEDWYFHPRILLEAINRREPIMGDCDDVSILTASLLKAAGIQPGFILYAQHDPKVYNHIVPCAFIDGHPIAMEVTMTRPFGWEPKYHKRGIVRL